MRIAALFVVISLTTSHLVTIEKAITSSAKEVNEEIRIESNEVIENIANKSPLITVEYEDIEMLEETEEVEEIVDLTQIYSYEVMLKDIDELIERYPNLEKKIIGKSRLGNDIIAIKLGTGKTNILIHSSHHAREWATTSIAMKMIEEYSKGEPEILNEVSMWFVPMVNPDGVILQQEGLEALPAILHDSLIDINQGSMDFKRWKANIAGVDLNRQYPAYRKEVKGTYSYANYSGKYPLMEPESFALYKFTLEITPEIVLSYHSSGEVIFHPTYMKDRYIAKGVSQLTGYSVQPLPPENLNGGYTDWFVKEFDKPALTIEIGESVKETNIPLEKIPGIWEKNKEVGLYIAEEAAKRSAKSSDKDSERRILIEEGDIYLLLR